MELSAFRKRVRKAFGEDLHKASPASIRDFLDDLTIDRPVSRGDEPFIVEESARSYEEVMRTFLARTLDLPSDQAVVHLWSACAELTYLVIASNDSDRLEQLFRGIDEHGPAGDDCA